ncbi:transglycosylase domain-containing protein [Alloiococcus sp. CFN-8]|uniref:transglycosylase domain-containing protein n=1 Tax=Alloiococcus sp. CFN-8 TaxID=3416081 RepID=UPI003CEBDF17
MGEKKKKKKKKTNKVGKIFKIISLTILFLVLTAGIGGGAYIYAVIQGAPEINVQDILDLDQVSMVYDDKGEYMDNVPTEFRRYSVSIDNIPKQLQDAFISIEDERFESHNGIDPRRIAGAIYTDVIKILKGERGFHGASTITQQLLKNTILSNEVRLSRKVTEIYLAIQLEDKLTKNQILEAYLNTIPIGGPTFGVEAAAEYYFNKSISELTLAESAYLAGATQDPTGYNAFMDSNIQDPSRYINRTKTVLGKMLELQKISNEDYNNAIAEIDAGNLQATFAETIQIRQSAKNKLNFEWFTRPVIDQVKKALIDRYKYTEAEATNLLNNGGLKIYSTMNRELQNHTQDVINNDPSFNSVPGTDENGILKLQASAVVMDYKTGQVKAMVGGRGDQPALSYNRAYDEHYRRAPGSTLKPISVYAPAIDSNTATAGTVIEDSPLVGDLLKEYKEPVRNSPNVYSGYINMRDAVRRSVNVYAVKLVSQMRTISTDYTEAFGIDVSRDKGLLAPLGLGQLTKGTTTFEMATAYGAFGNNGLKTDPVLFTRVEDKNGNVILESSINQKQVIKPETAFIVYDLLKGPLSYTATNVNLRPMPAGGKTGTSSKTRDLWFSGLTPHYSASVWVGKDKYDGENDTLEGLYSSNKSASVWSKIMKKANEGLPTTDITMPSGIVRASVCSVSGHLPTELCKKGHAGKTAVVTDYFIKGTVPTTLCDIHVEEEVNSENNKLANENTPEALRVKKVFIKRDYKPSVKLSDEQYVVPTEKDDTPAAPTIPDPVAPPKNNEGGNNETPGNNRPGNGNDAGNNEDNGNAQPQPNP